MNRTDLDTAAQMLADAHRVVVMTGAGVSAESGLSTFRDPEEGLWSQYDPMELAHIDAFNRDPELVTRWYHSRFVKARDCQPNPGHEAIAEMQAWLFNRGRAFSLMTQNVDGLHQRAGSAGVIELHGTILTWRGVSSGERFGLDQIDFRAFPTRSAAGEMLRPCVVWFGETLPDDAVHAAQDDTAACDLFLTVGTSAVVWPAAGFVEVARSAGAQTIEVNLDDTPATDAIDIALRGKSGEILPQLFNLAKQAASTDADRA